MCGLAARGATRLPWPARYRTGRQSGSTGEKLRCDKLRVRIRGRIAGNRNRILRFGGVMSTDIEIKRNMCCKSEDRPLELGSARKCDFFTLQ